MMQSITFTAAAKLILFGEHAVLSGAPAVAIPIFKNAVQIQHRPAANIPVQCVFPQRFLPAIEQQLTAAVQKVQNDFKCVFTGEASISFFVPPGCGLGMSAALAVCLLRWVQENQSISSEHALAWLQKQEDFHHGGRASGIDHHTIFNQQPTLLQNKKVTVLPPNFLSEKIQKNCVVFFTGVPSESTAQMIQHTQANRHPQDIARLTQLFTHFLETQNKDHAFISTINGAGQWLESIAAVNPNTAKKCAHLRAQGGGVKICGAGGFATGSGFGLAYHEDMNVLRLWLDESGFSWCALGEQLGPNNGFVVQPTGD